VDQHVPRARGRRNLVGCPLTKSSFDLAVDLGPVTPVDRVVVRWGPAYATAYWLEESDDLLTWTRVWPPAPDASGDQTATLAISARHVAVVARAGVNPFRYDLASLEVYGPAPPTPVTPSSGTIDPGGP
jgi:hypothetical protein